MPLNHIYFIGVEKEKKLYKHRRIRFFITAILLLLLTDLFSQQTYRRHFIVAYDISTPSIKAVNTTPAYTNALINLFSGNPVSGYNEANQERLKDENKTGLLFFDKNRDEISFFHFNIVGSELKRLWWIGKTKGEKEIVTEFEDAFLKDKNFNWTKFGSKNNQSIGSYFAKALSIQAEPLDFTGGVSMSNFVYPLVLNKLDTTSFAEEYILIILSDFKTGSSLGNTADLNRVRDIFRVPYGESLSLRSPVSYVKKNIDYLSSQYTRTDYFQYSFGTTATQNLIGIIGYKIKPQIGIQSPEDFTMFVDGNLDLKQRGYRSQSFKTSETKIKFTHNQKLIPTELRLNVLLPVNGRDSSVFNDIVAKRNVDGIWESKYTNDNRLMEFDSSYLTYYIPVLKIEIDSTINQKGFQQLSFNFTLEAKYVISDAQPLNFIYNTERSVPIADVDFSTKAIIITMYFILPILAVICLIIFFINYGKPRKISVELNGYLDSLEVIDYKTVGKFLTPFKAWDGSKQNIDYLLIKGELEYKSKRFIGNWNPTIYLQLEEAEIPTGFGIFLKQDTEDLKEFGLNTPLTVIQNKEHAFKFFIGLRQNDINKQITEPELIKIKVVVKVKKSILFIKSELREEIKYAFKIGPDMGDVWVGFDPGTTGSCIAVGSSTENIILSEDLTIRDIDNPQRKIVPSVVGFDKEQNVSFENSSGDLKYTYGNTAYIERNNPKKYSLYYSIKKLLGFKNYKKITFNNGTTIELKGKQLAGLLIEGLFKEVNDFFLRSGFNADDYKKGGEVFKPQRAVVAIPNNFTISKIQDMIDCITNLNQFIEIRYVYEAEAVLFYYISNFTRLCKGEVQPDSETILVFDMGGATINTTVVTVNKVSVKGRTKYNIDLLGKIGYGVGGDTIDYCIIKFILSFKSEFIQLTGIDIFEKKQQLSTLALQIKKEIISNYYSDNDHLILAFDLADLLRLHLGVLISIDIENSSIYSYFKKEKGKFKLFEHPLFSEIIYNNVADAVTDVVELSGSLHIDKIIFSGRSTSFPIIKETVINKLKRKEGGIKVIPLTLEESKVAVALGTCWYGVNKSSVQLNNLKTNAAFGYRKTVSTDKTKVKFHELVPMGRKFDSAQDGLDSFQGIELVTDDFANDARKVNFYQVMGKDADKILSEEQKHKYSKVASIEVPQVTSKVGMRVNENDEVQCVVELESNQRLIEKGIVSDQDVEDANEEHYTWIIK